MHPFLCTIIALCCLDVLFYGAKTCILGRAGDLAQCLINLALMAWAI